ncbi:MAG TPA: hypothetical protein VGX91_03360 [Candidatus Cybelea sp.]|jgi:hypothetical protein|nr:hypothetical protein [Candidatus Cybelea sp.]
MHRAFALAAVAMAAGCAGARGVLPASELPEGMVRGSVYATRLTSLAHAPPEAMQFAVLMTDGSVLTQSQSTWNTWYRYAPGADGRYANGAWKRIATLPAGYGPSAFASQVLADGRLLLTGGEYNQPFTRYPLQLTNLGAVYDPVKNSWTPLGHPPYWGYIGDSPSTLLPDGRLLIGQKLTERDAVLDPATLHWSAASDRGKADYNAEEGWTLLPDGKVLVADVRDAPNSEIYDPAAGRWKSAGTTIVELASVGGGCVRYGPKKKDCYFAAGEIGPAILRPDGSVFYTGAGTQPSGSGTGYTAIYHTRGSMAGKWSAGPQFPTGVSAGDTYAALEPSGNVLVFAKGALLEFDGTGFKRVGVDAGAPILLPTGQIMMLGPHVVLYTPSGKPQAAWAPTIRTYPHAIAAGKTYEITGTQFNGLSQAMSFGDEFQNSTNYPLVRITNRATHHVFYARTHDHSTMGVATGSKLVWTYFDVPAKIDAGASTLEVIANGIASHPVTVSASP